MSKDSQPVEGGLTRSAIFITLSVNEGDAALERIRDFLGEMGGIVKAIGFRNAQAELTCVAGLGAGLWERLNPEAKPQGLHPFKEVIGVHHAPSTPGDLLLHVRASSLAYCFEAVSHLMVRIQDAVRVEDETQGFKFFDNRDLLGFVDGTENPVGVALDDAVLVGDEDPAFKGASYVVVQKYLHQMERWNAMPVEHQERIIGRHKLSDIEQQDDEKASYAHNVLTNIEDADGNALEILRDNMPFGSPARGEFGTYFIGYACEPGRIETMLDNMFVGKPAGNYDRILDVSTAVTGGLFFIPTVSQLASLAVGESVGARDHSQADPLESSTQPATPESTGSLKLGSLKKANMQEDSNE